MYYNNHHAANTSHYNNNAGTCNKVYWQIAPFSNFIQALQPSRSAAFIPRTNSTHAALVSDIYGRSEA